MRNKFEIAPQALLLSVGVILSVVLISIMVVQFEQARGISEAVSENMLSATERIRNSEIIQYDGLRVKGAEVRNFYKLHLTNTTTAEFDKIIIDNGTKLKEYSTAASYSMLTEINGEGYVDPADIYLCSVEKNANGVITNVKFVRE